MFKLPEPTDYFKKNVTIAVPKQNGGYHKGKFVAKFRYKSQEWFDQFSKNRRGEALEDQADDFIESSNAEEQTDTLADVMYGFEGIEVGGRELDDTNQDDLDWMIKTGPYSPYFRVALIRAFFKSFTDATGTQSKAGNS